MKLSDFKGIFKKSIAKVISVDNPYEDYYTIKLKFEKNITWEAGEHAIFTLKDNEVEGRKWRAFSIASITQEGFLLLGTRTGKNISSFKKELINMKKGDRVSVRGPFGWFKLKDETSPLVMFAGGVGITPIRAILKELEENKSRKIEIIYASSDYYLYGDEIEYIINKNENMKLYKTTSSKDTSEKILSLAKKYDNRAYYYNSGAPKALKSIKSQLKNVGIKSNHIIDDTFLGY